MIAFPLTSSFAVGIVPIPKPTVVIRINSLTVVLSLDANKIDGNTDVVPELDMIFADPPNALNIAELGTVGSLSTFNPSKRYEFAVFDMCNGLVGDVIPMPTLPFANIVILVLPKLLHWNNGLVTTAVPPILPSKVNNGSVPVSVAPLPRVYKAV